MEDEINGNVGLVYRRTCPVDDDDYEDDDDIIEGNNDKINDDNDDEEVDDDDNGNTEEKTNKLMPHVKEKLLDVFLEEETLTLWRPSENIIQYSLIPQLITVHNWPDYILQVYYAKFDCVSSVLPFDDAVPIITHQATNLLPTQDHSILRNYPKIKGLWYKPDRSDSIGVDDVSIVGNIKFSFSFSQSESETLFSNLNVYFLEVMDYGTDDESVSRFLLTTNEHKDLPKYDLFKPGGPIYVRREMTENGPKETYYYLKICHGFGGKPMKHVAEFMMEEDPWPMCNISAVSHRPLNDPAALVGAH
ncbi:hypothetical protein FSP39_007622 [Pinctada imbricata]|uniref:Uncharacterized protein n=1 Tax=Pinctada imbricata TaxID=66713 RepID=A0AA88YT89_PINIB|nr:hypothetical protein FSP39_007622 [Pinctada imbricata]